MPLATAWSCGPTRRRTRPLSPPMNSSLPLLPVVPQTAANQLGSPVRSGPKAAWPSVAARTMLESPTTNTSAGPQ